MLSSAIFSDHTSLKLSNVGATLGGAPVAAGLVITNGAFGQVTFASKKGQAIGNATTVTITGGSAGTCVVTGTSIVLDINPGTTTAANIVTLISGTPAAAALVTATATAAGVMIAAAVQSLTGGDDKISETMPGVVSIVRDGAGVFTVTLSSAVFACYGGFVDVVGDAAISSIAKVEVVPTTDPKVFTLRFVNFSGAAADVAAASHVRGFIVGRDVGVIPAA